MIMLPLLYSSSCKPRSDDAEILKEFQKSVPFQIILPSYLPDNLNNHTPLFQGPWADTPTVNITSIRMTYEGGLKMIIIDEQNRAVDYSILPEEGMVFQIKGIQIIEKPSGILNPSNEIDGSTYGWNLNDINYRVNILGYDQTESRKVVESMIK